MGIYIKGMEMPRTHPITVEIYPDGTVLSKTVGRMDIHGQAVPVPPHGDLIDRDALLKKCEFVCTDDDADIRAVRYNIIENTPTIIEEER